jgi:hypothetical protein
VEDLGYLNVVAYAEELAMKRSLLLLVALGMGLALAPSAFAASKDQAVRSQMCNAKLANKHVKKADWKTEYAKCLSDPTDY